MKDEEQAAYLAGLIDGEGSIHIAKQSSRRRRGTYYSLYVSILNTEPQLLREFQKKFGGNIVPHAQSGLGSRQVYSILYGANKAALVLQMLLPYLRSPQKIAAAKFGLRFQARKTRKSLLNRTAIYRRYQRQGYEKMRRINNTAPRRLPDCYLTRRLRRTFK